MKNRKHIYLAASFACDSREETEKRKQAIEQMVALLQNAIRDATWYVPHQLVIPNAWDMTMGEWARAVYDADIAELDKADLVIFLSFGKCNNAGSAWECGYAQGSGKPVIMIRMTDNTESVMLYGSAWAILDKHQATGYDWDELPRFITSSLYRSKYTLS